MQVDGEILFNNTTIAIEQLTGQLDQSRIEVAGILPLFEPQPDLENPLQVSIKPTNITIPNLYQGNLAGFVTVQGSALAPSLTGMWPWPTADFLCPIAVWRISPVALRNYVLD